MERVYFIEQYQYELVIFFNTLHHKPCTSKSLLLGALYNSDDEDNIASIKCDKDAVKNYECGTLALKTTLP